jgi:Tol biopolymer transport system component
VPRTLRPDQRAELWVVDVDTGERRHVLTSTTMLFEAPNWTPDGRWLVVNGDGRLFRTPADGSGALKEIDLAGVPEINNDHVVSPDGATVYVSAEDGHLYAVPFAGGSHRRVTDDRVTDDGSTQDGRTFRHYLHGVSPDGATLAYIGLEQGGQSEQSVVRTNVFTVPTAGGTGGTDVQLTDDEFADDGAEFGPDGEWIYLNSERPGVSGERRAAGHAQLFRLSLTTGAVEQLTDDERVNWFPHPSPDGSRLAYVSFPPGTLGHPEDRDVVVRLRENDGTVRDLVALLGGQGTINVPSWAPDGVHLAYVAYPVGE